MRLVLALILMFAFAPTAGAEVHEGQADFSSTLPPEWQHDKGFADDSHAKAKIFLDQIMGSDEIAHSAPAKSTDVDSDGTGSR